MNKNDIPPDLKWIVERYPKWLNHHYDHVGIHRCEGFDPIVWHCYGREPNSYTREQYNEAVEILITNNQ